MFTRLLGRWLANNHHEATLLGIEFAGFRSRYLTYESIKNQMNENTAKKESITKKIGLGYLLYSLRTIIWLFQVIKILSINTKHSIDIIHAQDSGYTGLAAILAGKILKVPVMISLHGIRYSQIEANPYVNKMLKKIVLKIEHKLDVFTLTNADLVTLVSSTMRHYVKLVAPTSRIITMPVAINTKNFEFSATKRHSIRKELVIDKDSILIGFVGRLSYEKNLFTLLDSFAEAVKSESSLKLALVGEGPLEFELRKKAGELRIENKVIFCGFRNDIADILSGIDIFILPSFIEGTSNALIQAMTSGRAIICSDISGNREVVTNDKDTIMINPDSTVGITKAILLVSSDKNLRYRLGQNAKNNAAQYDEDIIFPKYLKYYHDLSSPLPK